MLLLPNRPDALGVFADSPVGKDEPLSQSRYQAAFKRLVARLLNMAAVASGSAARGKRRIRAAQTGRPQDVSNTIRVYVKALEIWSYYSIAVYGSEIEPRQITLEVANQYAQWLAGQWQGPDIRPMYARALGQDHAGLYEALARACKLYGQVSIAQVVEQLDPALRSRLIVLPTDARIAPDYSNVHTKLGKIIRSFRSVVRSPTSAEIRAQDNVVWGVREKDPLTYSYTIIPRGPLAPASVRTYLGAMSSMWNEMSKPTTVDEPPIAFNPWRDVHASWARRSRKERDNARLSGATRELTTPLVRAMLVACSGSSLECRRDFLAISLLTFTGLRAEELAGLLRKDIWEDGPTTVMSVLGKGAKVRRLPVFSNVRDAWAMLTARLQEDASELEDGEPTYHAIYARSLLSPEAPAVPSLVRWGCNAGEKQPDRQPAKDALEPMDTSGVRAMIDRIATRARVKEVASGIVRPLTDCTQACKGRACTHEKRRVHPHAFRHYAATAATQAGVPLQLIQQMLGHESIRTTEGYVDVAPQASMAFSAGVYQMLSRRGPLTPEQLASMQTRELSPVDEPGIVEASAQEMVTVRSAAQRVTPLSEKQASETVAIPLWAYEQPEPMTQVLRTHYREFSVGVKKEEEAATRAVVEAQTQGDAETLLRARMRLREVQDKMKWNTFRVGQSSRLPWWAGKSNREVLAPVPSYAQIAPENEADAAMQQDVRAMYDQLWSTAQPTAAMAMLQWFSELTQFAARQLALLMQSQGMSWVAFAAEARPDRLVLREHLPRAFTSWLEEHGLSLKATGYKNDRNRGNIAIAAMDSLPDWFWVEDALADPQRGLVLQDRRALADWVQKLQGRRPSRARFESWLEQMVVRCQQWQRVAADWCLRTGKSWEWSAQGDDEQATWLGSEGRAIAQEIKSAYPRTLLEADVQAITQGASSEDIRSRLLRMLESEGVPEARIVLQPAMPSRSGAKHLFDPSLLTFDARFTIVHPPDIQRWWFEAYGTSSELAVRRALRSLWDRRLEARSEKHNLLIRYFDQALSSVVPGPAEMERRIAQGVKEFGWTPPSSPEQVLTACKALWLGATDQVRQTQGISRAGQIQDPAVEKFWQVELPTLQALAVAPGAQMLPNARALPTPHVMDMLFACIRPV